MLEGLLVAAIVIVSVQYWRDRGYGIVGLAVLAVVEIVLGFLFLLWQRF